MADFPNVNDIVTRPNALILIAVNTQRCRSPDAQRR
jgi:hypothetical protein